jgi:hypothetical protein
MSSHLASQDIDPEESVSQIVSQFETDLNATSSQSTFQATTSELDAFRAYFLEDHRPLSDDYLLIENDSVTLTRAKAILEVFHFIIPLLLMLERTGVDLS